MIARSPRAPLPRSRRRQSRRADFPAAASHIVEVDGTAAGWAVVAPTPHGLHLVDIMVLPELRGKGIGSAAIEAVAATSPGNAVRLEVNPMNHGAIRLYERLGFRIVARDEVQYLMERP